MKNVLLAFALALGCSGVTPTPLILTSLEPSEAGVQDAHKDALPEVQNVDARRTGGTQCRTPRVRRVTQGPCPCEVDETWPEVVEPLLGLAITSVDRLLDASVEAGGDASEGGAQVLADVAVVPTPQVTQEPRGAEPIAAPVVPGPNHQRHHGRPRHRRTHRHRTRH